MSDHSTKLTELRDEVEAVDAEILRLFAKRQEIVRKIGAVKAAEGIPVRNAQVEDAVMKRQQLQAEALGLDPDAVSKLTEILVEHSVKEQIRIHARTIESSIHPVGSIAVIGARGGMGKIFSEQLKPFAAEILAVETAAKSQPGDVGLEEACARADIIVVATSLRSTPEILGKIVENASRALIVEISSIKSEVNHWLGAQVNLSNEFVSLHPMFGPSARDFVGRIFIVDSLRSQQRGINFVQILRQLGAQLVEIPIERHDHIVSFSLGLPHLINFIFGKMIENSGYTVEELLAITGTTFQRQFAVASQVVHQPAELYRDIQLLNPNTSALVQGMNEQLLRFEKSIETDHSFQEWLASCRAYFAGKK